MSGGRFTEILIGRKIRLKGAVKAAFNCSFSAGFVMTSKLDFMPKMPLPPRPSRDEAEKAVHTLLRWAGDDPAREGLIDTPARVARAFEDWFSGYGQDPEDISPAHLRRKSRAMTTWWC